MERFFVLPMKRFFVLDENTLCGVYGKPEFHGLSQGVFTDTLTVLGVKEGASYQVGETINPFVINKLRLATEADFVEYKMGSDFSGPLAEQIAETAQSRDQLLVLAVELDRELKSYHEECLQTLRGCTNILTSTEPLKQRIISLMAQREKESHGFDDIMAICQQAQNLSVDDPRLIAFNGMKSDLHFLSNEPLAFGTQKSAITFPVNSDDDLTKGLMFLTQHHAVRLALHDAACQLYLYWVSLKSKFKVLKAHETQISRLKYDAQVNQTAIAAHDCSVSLDSGKETDFAAYLACIAEDIRVIKTALDEYDAIRSPQ
jgi:hypothetical protein